MKFCFKLKKTVAETHEMLVQVYREEAVSKKCVHDWFKRFKDGEELLEDEELSGRPSTSRTDDVIVEVGEILSRDRRMTLRLMGEELWIIKDTVHIIVR